MIRIQGLSKSFGSKPILSEVSANIGTAQKVALVGPNGVGKTTLLRVLAGEEDYEGGTIELPKSACIGYMPQDPSLETEEDVRTYLRRVGGIADIEDGLDSLSDQLNDPAKLQKYEDLLETYDHIEGNLFDHRMKSVLAGFGLGNKEKSPILALSGGQRTKVVFAGILLRGVDLLLLDEPTNNLDLPALVWLENYLRKVGATCIIVSHDRKFLDRTISKIFELNDQSHELVPFSGSYSEFLINKEKELRRQREEYDRQQEEVGRLQKTADENRKWAARGAVQIRSDNDKFSLGVRRDRSAKSAKRVKGVEKKIEQMAKVDKPFEREPLEIPLQTDADKILPIELEDLVVGYQGGFRVGPFSLSIPYGARLGIVGANGTGKSTILKTVSGEIEPLAGRVVLSPNYHIGNLTQAHENVPRNQTLLEYLRANGANDDQEAYWLLHRFGIDSGRAGSRIAQISPGERARLIFASFSARSVNLLLLDEPTNHLDIEAISALEQVLGTYKGTVVIVSHDRYFLDRTKLTNAVQVGDGSVVPLGSWAEYESRVESEAQRLLRML